MSARIMRVPAAFLREALKLPADATIVDARGVFELQGAIDLVVEHPSFTPVPDCATIPFVNPVFTANGFLAWNASR